MIASMIASMLARRTASMLARRITLASDDATPRAVRTTEDTEGEILEVGGTAVGSCARIWRSIHALDSAVRGGRRTRHRRARVTLAKWTTMDHDRSLPLA